MSTPNLNVLLSASVAIYNNTQPNTPLLSRISTGNPTIGATAVFVEPFFQIPASTIVVIQLPANPSYGLLVQNLNASQTIQVLITPVGFLEATFAVGPGDVYTYWCSSKATGTGFIQVRLNGGASVSAVMLLVAA